MADEVAVLRKGRVVLHDSLEDLRERVCELETPAGAGDLPEVAGVERLGSRAESGATLHWLRCTPEGRRGLAQKVGSEAESPDPKEQIRWYDNEFTTKLYTIQTIETEQFNTQPVFRDESFAIEFPPGTHILDTTVGEVLTTDVDFEEIALSAADSIKIAKSNSPSRAGDTRPTAQPPSAALQPAGAESPPTTMRPDIEVRTITKVHRPKRRIALVSIAAGLCLAFAFLFFLYRRRR